MNMFVIKKVKTKNEEGEDVSVLEYDEEKQIGQQIAVSYSFGHW